MTQQPEEGKTDTQGMQEATSEDATAKEEYQQRALCGVAALEGHTQPLVPVLLAFLERSHHHQHEVTQSNMQDLRDANQAYTQGLRDVMRDAYAAEGEFQQRVLALRQHEATQTIMQGLRDANQTYTQGLRDVVQGLRDANQTYMQGMQEAASKDSAAEKDYQQRVLALYGAGGTCE
jgi:predicted ATP-binding protein involved in virulence